MWIISKGMQDQAENYGLIQYLEAHSDELSEHTRFLRKLTREVEQAAVTQESNVILARQLRKRLPLLEAHEAYVRGLITRITTPQD